MNFKHGLFVFSFIFILIALTAISGYAYISSCNYEEHSKVVTDKLHLMNKVENQGKKILEIASFGLYEGYSKDINELKIVIELSQFYKNRANQATLLFFGFISLFLTLLYIFHIDKKIVILSLLFISLICLIFGLIAPILRIITYKDIPLLGYTVFQFQSKAISSSIQELFASGNHIVALLILLFSVLIPIIKTIVMFAITLRFDLFAHPKIFNLIKHIGKWSMADVFVVSLLLAYFGLDKEGFTEAELQIGLYFFVGYVILSMIASHLITHSNSMES